MKKEFTTSTVKKLKTSLLEEDPELELGDDFFNQLHDKVMAQVEQTEIKEVTLRSQLVKHVSPQLKRRAAMGAALSLFCILFIGLNSLVSHIHQNSHKEFDIVVELVKESKLRPENLAAVSGIQKDDDFFIDVAGQAEASN